MYVKSITLENVRGFSKVHFDFGRKNSLNPNLTVDYAGWTVFVGGNASGKSTLLKSIALMLMGIDAGRELIGMPSGWISSEKKKSKLEAEIFWDSKYDTVKKKGAQPPSIFEAAINISSEAVSIPEKRTSKGSRISNSAERGLWNQGTKGWFCAGYGPMRRLSGSSSESIRLSVGEGAVSRFVTLFREDAALSESEAWLKLNHARWLESAKPEIKELNDGVLRLLNDNLLPYGMQITRVSVDHVYVKSPNNLELPMRDISDGCRSIYATILDLVHSMYVKYGIEGLFSTDSQNRPIVNCPGVVLIDEIEAHLHPTWQRDIPEWLKVHFPKVQFLVTTHSPLVVQAADPGGVFVLPSAGDSNQTPRQLNEAEIEKLRLGRAEKTLLGIAFGLKSTRSSWAEKQIERWKRLNAKRRVKELSPEEETEYQALHQQMNLAFEANAPEAC